MTKNNIIVVGGGIVGMRIATELCGRGQGVTLVSGDFERASEASLVWLNVISTETEDYARLRVASMRYWHQIMQRDTSCPIRLKGALLWDREPDALSKLADLQASFGWDCEVIDQNTFIERAPGIGTPPEAALWAPSEAAADPEDILTWAEARMTDAGVIRETGNVDTILQDNGCAVGVILSDGTRIEGSGVVLANGMGQTPLLEPFSLRPELRNAPGMLVRTTPVAPISQAILASPEMDFWQDSRGRVLIATGTHKTMVDDLDASTKAALAQLHALAPCASTAEVETRAMRIRPIPGDGFPLIGAVPGAQNLWMALSHSAMTLAPIIARSLADMVLGEIPVRETHPFLPRRLS